MGNSTSITMGDKVLDSLGINLHSQSDSDKFTPEESQQRRLKICQEILSTETT